jgi:hypothetical protein
MRDSISFIIVVFLICSFPAAAQKQSPTPRRVHAALSRDQRAHILDGEFSIVTTVEALPDGVKARLARLFKQEKLELANPDQKFNASDVGRPGRRLIFAGVSKDKCFIHYERGGIAHMYLVVVFEIDKHQNARLFWSGSGFHTHDLQELRSAIAEGRFGDARLYGQ